MATMLSTRSMELKHPHSHNPSINAHFDMNSPAPQQQQQQTPTPTVSDDELVAEAAADEKAINDILTGSVTGLSFDDSGGDQRFTVNDGQEEEKAEDAVDYEDMDELADDDDEDGDLPEEEDSEETKARRARGDDEDEDDFLKDLMNEAAGTGGMSAREAGSGGNLPDDLFGDMDVDMEDQGIGGSFGDRMELDSAGEMGMSFDGSGAKAGSGNIGYSGTFIKEEDTDEDDDALFNNYSFGTTQQQEPTKEELLQKWFPDFRHHEVLNFNALIPVKTATLPSRLTRVPKPCIPTKLSFEAAIDTERSFMKTTTAKHLTSNTEGVISIIQEESGDDSERQDSAIEDGSSEQLRQREIEIVCQDWDSMIDPPSDIEPIPEHNLHDMVMDGEQNVYELDIRSTKVGRRSTVVGSIYYYCYFVLTITSDEN